MRLTGFGLLLMAAFLFSAQCVARKTRLSNLLGDLADMLAQMEGELRRGDLQMDELLRLLEGGGQKNVCFLSDLRKAMNRLDACSFAELWSETLADTLPGLPDRVRREMDALGGVLGRYDAATQCAALENCRLAMSREREKLLREQPGYRRLVFGLSLSAAGMLGILMI